MEDVVEQILAETGGSLSTELADILVKRHNLTRVAARQRIARRNEAVVGSLDIPFARNSRFLYLKRYFGSSQYWDQLTKAMMANRSAYGLALAAIRQRGGLVPVEHFKVACGAPLKQSKHLSPETIYKRLQQAGLLDTYEISGVGPCIGLKRAAENWEWRGPELRARLITENVLLHGIKDWLRKLGLASYEKTHLREPGMKLPQVGTFAWDLSAPSYVAPMVQWDSNGPKAGFVACDVLLGSTVTEEGLSPFLNKCATLRGLSKVGRSMNVFVAERYTPAAFQLAKRYGIVPATPESLFGKEVAKALVAVIEIMTRAAHIAISPEIFEEVFSRLGRIEGAVANLRGAFFEFLVANVLRTRYNNVELNYPIKLPTGQNVEIDVLAWTLKKSITFIECKGFAPYSEVPDLEVEDWLNKTIPTTEIYARKSHPDWAHLDLHFEFWTTGKLTERARELIKKRADEVRRTKYTVQLYEPNGVKGQVRETNDTALLKVLEKYFLEDPLRAAERAVESRQKRPKSIFEEFATLNPDDLEPMVIDLGAIDFDDVDGASLPYASATRQQATAD